MADGTIRPIAAIAIGDSIQSFNETTGHIEARRVDRIFEARADVMMRVRCADGASILVTPTHKMATPSGWRAVGELRIGQAMWGVRQVAVANGLTTFAMALTRVVSLEPVAPHGSVYDLSVEECHTYFAGGLLAHNKMF
jgi:intein/homing endonuclease